jgi:uncharacterized protein (TIGR03435 family)
MTRKNPRHDKKIGLVMAGLLAMTLQGLAQATPSLPNTDAAYMPTLTFDVASIRQSPAADSYYVSGNFSPGSSTLIVTNLRIEDLLSIAYASPGEYFRMSGVPESLRGMRFNIQAKADDSGNEKLAKLNPKQEMLEQHHMLQILLAERFKLKTHWETREGDVYNLVLKNPSKLHESKGEQPNAEEVKLFGSKPVPVLYQRGDSISGFDYIAHGCSIKIVAAGLAGQVGRPVVDKTGLSGSYDFVLHYYGTTASNRDDNEINLPPPLETAIQEQLGIKLEPAKGPVPILIIDHVEKPSEN